MDKPLRKGWTTGACATAAAKAAWTAVLTGEFPDPVSIVLPRGETPSFALAERAMGRDWASAAVVKDAGDDPDVTHGATVRVTVSPLPAGSGLLFRAGEGVGTVTLPGLPLAVGEPAINPGPRTQIESNLRAVASGQSLDAEIVIAIPGGAALAAKTMNGRLGILGGLSILGTTGVVLPYSCAAWIHAIHRGVDVARACGLDHIAGCTGKTSERAVREMHGLPERAMIDMGGFAGALLKYLRAHPLPRFTLGGGFAKLTKLAAGALDLHSGATPVDLAWLAGLVGDLGGGADLVARARQAQSAAQILAMAEDLPLAQAVAVRARETALAVLVGGVDIDVAVFDRTGRLIGHAR
ncbi:cobalt-precorrin-5B (C(1))-methyltransferase [Telmatospirillum sp.]|uniref:cobalt-precorrin-5B (C(1))-methyltransferase n=1 Tax=Telmatospirillum sp. TaxID=2079197 RepID=UPI00283FF6F4|nr:cobalt-precorrin-5B (C(1))-methyltransferase [Telmatospirillum sp.]MDR3437554.1 cobalt-precorrin-5B (C(1))-methyltransferase [Telmatospirillum sp.]